MHFYQKVPKKAIFFVGNSRNSLFSAKNFQNLKGPNFDVVSFTMFGEKMTNFKNLGGFQKVGKIQSCRGIGYQKGQIFDKKKTNFGQKNGAGCSKDRF